MFRGLVTCIFCSLAFLCSGQEGKEFSRKLSPTLVNKLSGIYTADSLLIDYSYHSYSTGFDTLARQLQHHSASRTISAKTTKGNVYRLSLHKDIIFINAISPAREELNSGIFDLSLNRISFAQDRFPLVNGSSIRVTQKERLLDTTDIDLKGRIFKTGFENPTVTAHASLMATIIAGAGNSSPYAKGTAPASTIGSVSFDRLLPEPDSFFRAHSVSVQNHSYGTVVENFYGNDAAAYDASAFLNPQLLHVYSSGNSGNVTPASGIYSGIPAYANLTGNVKHAKNLLIVGAADSTGLMQAASSKGPAHDGRIKPELIAFGEDGASGAAALVSGTAALVQDAYKRSHNNTLPSSSLVKSILINSADDADVAQVDYRTGFGNLNAYKAILSVQQNRFSTGEVSMGEMKSFEIVVPPNAALIKITLAWTDSAALAGSARALVNDLDLRLREMASGHIWLPWVLSSAAHRDSLELPAARKRDTLNNVEQVTVENPPAGTFLIDVLASRLSTSTQAFSVSWSIDTMHNFYWTFPATSLPLKADRVQTLRWDTNLEGTGSIEYSLDGITWKAAGNVQKLEGKYFKWHTPDTLAAVLLRMNVSGGKSFLSDTFIISPQPDLRAGYDCADSFLLYWRKLSALQYEVSELQERYLQPVLTLADTVVIFRKAQHPSRYYAVTPMVGTRKGLRSPTLNYSAAINGCYLSGFYLFRQTQDEVIFSANLGTTIGVAKLGLQKLYSDAYLTVREVLQPTTTNIFLKDSNLVQGENYYRLVITLLNGAMVFGEPVLVYHFPVSQPVIVYPNPARQNASVTVLTNEAGRYTLEVADVQGRILLTRPLNATSTQLPASIFSKGIYFFRIMDREGGQRIKKLVVF